MSALLAIDGAVRRFGGIAAVDGVSLELGHGEFFALLGPSGCGKTTLLRMIAGLEAPDAGRIFIDGLDVTALPPNRRPVNTVFQSYALFPHMSVAANIAYGLKAEGVPAAERGPRVAEFLRLVRLEGYEDRHPDQLSGGQRQRVALARALIKRPRLLLLDEPLSALDAKLREQMRVELKRLQAETGVTFLLVTHDQQEALSMATRLAVMDKGRLEQVGAPSDLYERPASRFVADFIGQVNLFGGRVAEVAPDRAAVDCVELNARVVVRRPTTAAVGDAGWIGLRPEQVRLGPEGGDGVQGRIVQAAYMGQHFAYDIILPAGRLIRAQASHGPETRVFAVGDAVTISWLQGAPSLLLR